MAAAKKKPKAKVKPRKAPAAKPATRKKPTPIKKKAAAKKPAARPAASKQGPAALPVSRPRAAVPARPSPKPQPAAVAPARPAPLPGEELIGVVTHYYGHLSVAAIKIESGSLSVGDTIRILGHTSNFRQRVESMQVEHEPVTEAGRRQEIGLKVTEHAREGDDVYKVT
jgi:putative protease